MASQDSVQQTALHDLHVRHGGRMVDFAGWRLPVQYSGVIAEHTAVRERAGIFDVSHMGELLVEGPEACAFLQQVTCNDVKRLKPGRAHYTGLLTEAATFVDDLLIYCIDEQTYLLVVNAANKDKDYRWLRSRMSADGLSVKDVSTEWAQIAVQGPRAAEIVQQLVAEPCTDLRYYRFRRTEVVGTECILSRTGYTGEDGFEIYAPASAAPEIWEAAIKAGEPHGLEPCGLGARDTLRLEAKLALYGNDIDDTTTPLEADLAWIVKMKKGEFCGREVLARQAEAGISRRLVGFEIQGRKIPRKGYPALHGGVEVGLVTSGTMAPYLKKSIGLVYLPVELAAEGSRFEVEVRGRAEPAMVVPTPFYKRAD